MKNILLFCCLSAAILAQGAKAEDAAPADSAKDSTSSIIKSSQPYYISLAPELNQYYMYANGGWDGKWYVGYNSCWIVKLPPAPAGFAKVFIGAKLGRAKSLPKQDRPWEKVKTPGKIFMGISQTPSFTSQQSYFLTENEDIPAEASPKETLAGVGQAQWFWAEVPAAALSQDTSNYLALWATAEAFADSSNSPIVAGAPYTGSTEPMAWINRSIKGTPPREPETALETPVNGLAPAMAVKLVPQNSLKVIVRSFDIAASTKTTMVSFSVIGQDVRAAWLELSYDRFDWQRISGLYFQPPYSITLDKSSLPAADTYFLRAAAVDTLENKAYSKEITVTPSPQ